ncbi:MAG TPA: hypothetical protein VMZ11_01990 [Mycobacteriales bacterium]|nr:hypothetical protein [Mycobacteriales bacterium]
MPALLDDTSPERQPVPVRVLTKQQLGLLVLISAVLLAGTGALVFGPGRGIRIDIAHMTDDLDASRDGIFSQLDIARIQLKATERSLTIQEQGLQVAVAGEKDADTAARASQQILAQTRQALQLVREVTQALGPLDRLDDKVDSVVRNVAQGVRLARTALQVAEQTLATGQQALAVAKDTLATLKRSEQLQIELLKTARATLEQTREINRKIPGVPIFPTTSSPKPAAGTGR